MAVVCFSGWFIKILRKWRTIQNFDSSNSNNRQHLACTSPFTDVNLFTRGELQYKVTQIVAESAFCPKLSTPESRLLVTTTHYLLSAFQSLNMLRFHDKQHLFLYFSLPVLPQLLWGGGGNVFQRKMEEEFSNL